MWNNGGSTIRLQPHPVTFQVIGELVILYCAVWFQTH